LQSLIGCLPFICDLRMRAGQPANIAVTSERLAADATASVFHAQLIATGLGTYRV
jgi:hypothetical protein